MMTTTMSPFRAGSGGSRNRLEQECYDYESIVDRIRRCAIEKFVFITRNSAIWCGLTIYILFSYYIYLFFVCNCETKRVKGSK